MGGAEGSGDKDDGIGDNDSGEDATPVSFPPIDEGTEGDDEEDEENVA